MKFGMRTPSPKKSLKARTTGSMKRSAKSSLNPYYGKKGVGLINDPKRSAYNFTYNKTTTGLTTDETASCLGCLILVIAFIVIFFIL